MAQALFEDVSAFASVSDEAAQVLELLHSLGATDGEYLYHVVQTLLDGARNPYQSGVALLLARAISGEVPAEVVRFAAAITIVDVAALAHRQTAPTPIEAALSEPPAIDAHLVVLAGDYLYAQAAYITAGLRNLRVMALLAEEIKSQCRREIERQNLTGSLSEIGGLYSLSVLGTGQLLGCDSAMLQQLRVYGHALDAAASGAHDSIDLPAFSSTLLDMLPDRTSRSALRGLVSAAYRHATAEAILTSQSNGERPL